MAEREGFEPPVPVKARLISSQLHSTGLCHLSAFHEGVDRAKFTMQPQRSSAFGAPCYYPCMRPTTPRGESIQPALAAEGMWAPWLSLGRYLTQSEVHTYAFSVAANAILSLFPFIVLMFTVARRVLHSQAMAHVIGDMLFYFLPANQEFVVRNMSLLVHPHGGVQVLSFLTLLVSSSGVFLPLEVALNRVWKIEQNRSYWLNQLVSLGLALVVGLLALFSVGITALQSRLLTLLFFGHTGNFFFTLLAHSFLRLTAAFLSITIFFAVYWVLPNRKLPLRAVLPTAVFVGVLWEVAKVIYVHALRWIDLAAVYGPFSVSVGLMIWAFVTGLLLLAGAHFSANRYTRHLLVEAEREKAAAETSG